SLADQVSTERSRAPSYLRYQEYRLKLWQTYQIQFSIYPAPHKAGSCILGVATGPSPLKLASSSSRSWIAPPRRDGDPYSLVALPSIKRSALLNSLFSSCNIDITANLSA